MDVYQKYTGKYQECSIHLSQNNFIFWSERPQDNFLPDSFFWILQAVALFGDSENDEVWWWFEDAKVEQMESRGRRTGCLRGWRMINEAWRMSVWRWLSKSYFTNVSRHKEISTKYEGTGPRSYTERNLRPKVAPDKFVLTDRVKINKSGNNLFLLINF